MEFLPLNYLKLRRFLAFFFCKRWSYLRTTNHIKWVFQLFIYLFIYLLFSHNKDYTSITLYKDVARGPQKTTRLVRGGPLVTIILSNRTITTHNKTKGDRAGHKVEDCHSLTTIHNKTLTVL